jgi:hypothetical protein
MACHHAASVPTPCGIDPAGRRETQTDAGHIRGATTMQQLAQMFFVLTGEISSYHSDEYEDGCLPGCCAAQTGRH